MLVISIYGHKEKQSYRPNLFPLFRKWFQMVFSMNVFKNKKNVGKIKNVKKNVKNVPWIKNVKKTFFLHLWDMPPPRFYPRNCSHYRRIPVCCKPIPASPPLYGWYWSHTRGKSAGNIRCNITVTVPRPCKTPSCPFGDVISCDFTRLRVWRVPLRSDEDVKNTEI